MALRRSPTGRSKRLSVVGSCTSSDLASVRCVYSVFTPSHHGGSGSPLVCLHGIMDTWRTWELVLGELQRHHEVLALTLLGHAGGPPLEGALMASVEGRRRAAQLITTNSEHIPAELLAHLTVGGARCQGALPMIEYAIREATGPSKRRRSPVRCGSYGARPTSSCRSRQPPRGSATTGSRTPTGWSSKASATAPNSTFRSRPRS